MLNKAENLGCYKDLREYVQVLEQNGRLVRIKRKINKDTELMPLVRWQFRGLPQKDRKAFLFENVTDVKGKKYDTPVLVGSHSASCHAPSFWATLFLRQRYHFR